ncbi:MAG: prepilin-type N-terminal cleavage/methylation domain-containing protein [Patescibacteria group bacterium]
MRGFTLVEMMVVLFIIVIVTTVAVTGQGAFNRSLILTDTAYTIAFSLREAQSFGLSSRSVTPGVYNAGYGIRFSSQTPSAYVLFADTNPVKPGNDQSALCPGHPPDETSPDSHPGDCIYDPSATPAELVRTYTLNRGYEIYRFCGGEWGGGEVRCSGVDFETMHITFMRPSTDTVIFGIMQNGNLRRLTNATIYLRSPDGEAERCITVSKVGQIAVGDCS